MGDSLQKRIDSLVKQVFGAGTGAWLVWCDSQREWEPLLDRVATDRRLGGFPLVKLEEHTAESFGGPLARKQVQEQIERGESFVLYAPVDENELGWLWAQALLAEAIYDRSLRAQLLDWGWRPPLADHQR